MSPIDVGASGITFRITHCEPAMSGKTINLHWVCQTRSEMVKGQFTSLQTLDLRAKGRFLAQRAGKLL